VAHPGVSEDMCLTGLVKWQEAKDIPGGATVVLSLATDWLLGLHLTVNHVGSSVRSPGWGEGSGIPFL
jgi:hypothetical protein